MSLAVAVLPWRVLSVDLNADAGESFGPWRLGRDAELLPQLSSVNLACGFHAGDPLTMRRSVALALGHGVAIGAHPGYRDLAGFGRRVLHATPDELYADVLYQMGALSAFLRPFGRRLHHVKPHGALYLRMLEHKPTAEAVVAATRDFDAALPLVSLAGPGGEAFAAAARGAGLRVVLEAFPDRGYLDDGTLAPRAEPGALVTDPNEVAARALTLARDGWVAALSGRRLALRAETLCLHGDAPHAPEAAQAVRRALADAGIAVGAY